MVASEALILKVSLSVGKDGVKEPWELVHDLPTDTDKPPVANCELIKKLIS